MKKGQKMSQEQRDKISKSKKGKKFSEEHIRKLSESHKGKIPTNIDLFKKYNLGRKFSKEHIEKIRLAQIGKKKNISPEGLERMRIKNYPVWNKGLIGYNEKEKNPRWIKDRTKVKKFEKRIGSLYSQWRKECHKRDKYTCRLKSDKCSKGKLEVHHIERWNDKPELRYDVSNGITLCHFHHPRKKEDEVKLIPIFRELIS